MRRLGFRAEAEGADERVPQRHRQGSAGRAGVAAAVAVAGALGCALAEELHEVTGAAAHPFYKWAQGELGEAAEPKWNFHKILIGADGQAVAAFGSRTEPQDPEIVAKVEAAL